MATEPIRTRAERIRLQGLAAEAAARALDLSAQEVKCLLVASDDFRLDALAVDPRDIVQELVWQRAYWRGRGGR